MGNTDLVFVVENYGGVEEHNVLYTKDELINHLKKFGAEDMVEDIRFLLGHETAKHQWKSLHTETGCLEFRCCKDEEDLQNFIDGKYNDSIEKMEERNLSTLDRHAAFRWKTDFASFSPNVMYLFDQFCQSMPLLSVVCRKQQGERPDLEDVLAVSHYVAEKGRQTEPSAVYLDRNASREV